MPDIKPKLTLLKLDNNNVEFMLEGVTPAIANSLRRAIVSEVPTLAIDEVVFLENNTVLFDEIIAHRLALIPLRFPRKEYKLPSECSCKGKGCSKCQVILRYDSKKVRKERNAENEKLLVMSGDLESDNEAVKPISDEIPIVVLMPGQELQFEAIARLGLGKVHAKWQASNAWYRVLADVRINKNKCNNCKACVKACPKGVLVVEDGKVKVKNPDACDLCNACVEACEKDAIKVSQRDGEFVFTIESTSGLTAREVLESAIESLEKRLKELERKVK